MPNETQPKAAASQDHEAHEQRLAAALHDLVRQVDIGEYRDRLGHDLKNNMAFLKAQAIVDEFGLTHDQLCRTLDECDAGGDLLDAARRIFEMRRAKPADTPVEYRTWRTGP
jgi:hypothetical protein